MCFLLLESLGCPIPRPQNQSIILLQLKVGQAHASYEVYVSDYILQESMHAREVLHQAPLVQYIYVAMFRSKGKYRLQWNPSSLI